MAQSKEEIATKEHERYLKNRDHYRMMHQKWHAANRESVAARKKLARLKEGHKEKSRGYAKESGRRNSAKRLMYNRKIRYGLTEDAYYKLLELQDSKCAICKVPLVFTSPVDHCHKLGGVRGLLCKACNNGLGQFKDSPSLLREAANYIERYENGVKK